MSEPEKPSRHPRSANGLVGALLVTLLVVLVFVGFRALFRDQPEIRPEPVDYLGAVAGAQDSGLTLVYPSELPSGWIATGIDLDPGEEPAWGLNLLTADGTFVGLRQEDEDVDDLLATYVDESAERGDEVTLDSTVASSWTTWSDDGGDLAYSTEPTSLDDQTVLVYGSASAADQEELIGLLTTEPIGG